MRRVVVVLSGVLGAVIAVVLTALLGPRLMTEEECADLAAACAAPFPSTTAFVLAGGIGAVLGAGAGYAVRR